VKIFLVRPWNSWLLYLQGFKAHNHNHVTNQRDSCLKGGRTFPDALPWLQCSNLKFWTCLSFHRCQDATGHYCGAVLITECLSPLNDSGLPMQEPNSQRFQLFTGRSQPLKLPNTTKTSIKNLVKHWYLCQKHFSHLNNTLDHLRVQSKSSDPCRSIKTYTLTYVVARRD